MRASNDERKMYDDDDYLHVCVTYLILYAKVKSVSSCIGCCVIE